VCQLVGIIPPLRDAALAQASRFYNCSERSNVNNLHAHFVPIGFMQSNFMAKVQAGEKGAQFMA